MDMSLPYIEKINIFEKFCVDAPILGNFKYLIRTKFGDELMEKITKYLPRPKSFQFLDNDLAFSS